MTMCPTYTFIDRANGRFNDNMTFKREYAALISAAWEIDKAYDQFLSDFDFGDTNDNPLKKLGIHYDADMSTVEVRKSVLKKLMELEKDHPLRKRLIGNASATDLDAMSMREY